MLPAIDWLESAGRKERALRRAGDESPAQRVQLPPLSPKTKEQIDIADL